MMARRFLFRVFLGALLLISPLVFPGVLLVLRMATMENLREIYRDFWKMFLQGFA